MRTAVRFLFRGRPVTIDALDPAETLLDRLRLGFAAPGTKEGCAEGDCGACTVVLARREAGRIVHRPVNACILLTGQADGAEVLTVEDLAPGGALHPVQAALVKHHGSQCGFCTPGIVMSLFAAYQEAPRPVARTQMLDQLAGNLCRCTGYRPIVEAALDALAGPAEDSFTARAAERAQALAALEDEADVFVGGEAGFFAAPARLEVAADLLARHPDATILSGATDVGLWVTKRLDRLDKVVWLGRVRDLQRLEGSADGLFLGAGVRLAEAMPALAAFDPTLGEVLRRFGSEQVRASGTVVGNLANGSPIGDLAPAFLALGASLELRHGAATRALPLEAFFLGYGRQDRRPGELVTAVRVRRPGPGQALRAYKLSKRPDEDISAVMGAFLLTVAGEGRIVGARIAYGGMAAVPKRAQATEAALLGARLGEEAGWTPALDALAADFTPIDDVRASAWYRMEGARALLIRALRDVAARPAAGIVGAAPRDAAA